ncbi:MAG: type II toxin-antitoxin system RelE/ParE family toxin [Acetobacteraceae bacterium]|nr:type II toxin-antitoxin system RelE/ParE family toxin [Acetobacteraceae bacterium]
MPRKLRYTHRALADLDAIRLWQTQPGAGLAAVRQLIAIRAAIRRLRQDPCLHPCGDHPGVRELPCEGGYRVLYQVDPDTGRSASAGDVMVLRVFGPGQSRDQL